MSSSGFRSARRFESLYLIRNTALNSSRATSLRIAHEYRPPLMSKDRLTARDVPQRSPRSNDGVVGIPVWEAEDTDLE